MNAASVDVAFTLEELWCLVDHVRDHQAGGREWDKGTMRALQEAVLIARADEGQKATVRLEAAGAWQITRQVPSVLSVGTRNVGRSILESVYLALRELEPLEPLTVDTNPIKSAVAEVFQRWAREEDARALKVWEEMGG